MAYDRAWLDRVLTALAADPEYQLEAHLQNVRFTLGFGGTRFAITVQQGKVTQVLENPGFLDDSTFTLAADTAVWDRIFAPVPPAFHQHIFGAMAHGFVRLDGSTATMLQTLTLLTQFTLCARALNGATPRPADPPIPDSYQAVGRFVNVKVGGETHKVFYFEAGQGIPVLCQHTAGTDNTQWRYLMEDKELTKRFRFIAYDLPGHSKSEPPLDGPHWSRKTVLKKDWVVEFILAFSKALTLDRPAFIGCSIGGAIAHMLAAAAPDSFRGLIGLAGTNPTGGFFHDWWTEPKVNSFIVMDAVGESVIAPTVPERNRRVVRWLQTRNDSRTLRDDLYLWGVENTDPGIGDKIDPKRVKLIIYAGEYDFTCTPDQIRAGCERIGPEVHFEVLKGLGHYPMTEDYDKFRPYLVKALDMIAPAGASGREAAE
jgi:pimeloyl-ACP methyl ester carboxylesterase